jgi:sigma-E factor negative regulatory protein RseB
MRSLALRLVGTVRALPFLLPVSAAFAQTDTSALQWLQRVYTATQKLSYSGVFVYQQGQQVETSRITHIVDASGPRERLETLDGVPREIIRTGDEVICYLPASKAVKIDKQYGSRVFRTSCPSVWDLPNYDIHKGKSSASAGTTVRVIIEPRTGCAWHRFWVDLHTGMLLKAKTFDENGEMVEHPPSRSCRSAAQRSRKLKARFPARAGLAVEDLAVRTNLPKPADHPFRSPGFRTVTELPHRRYAWCRAHRAVRRIRPCMFIQPAKSMQPAPRVGLCARARSTLRARLTSLVTVVGAPAESVKYIADAVEFASSAPGASHGTAGTGASFPPELKDCRDGKSRTLCFYPLLGVLVAARAGASFPISPISQRSRPHGGQHSTTQMRERRRHRAPEQRKTIRFTIFSGASFRVLRDRGSRRASWRAARSDRASSSAPRATS